MKTPLLLAAVAIAAATALSGCLPPPSASLSQADQRACQTASSVSSGTADADNLLNTAGFQAISGSVIQSEIFHVLGDLRDSSPDYSNDLGYLLAMCQDGVGG